MFPSHRIKAILGMAFFLALALALYVRRPHVSPPLKLSGPTMGTTWHVTVQQNTSLDVKTLQDDIEKELRALNQTYSTYDAQSVIRRFSDRASTQPFKVPPDFIFLLDLARQVHIASGGVYDVTVAPLVRLWGFGAKASSTSPSPTDVTRALDCVGMDKLVWDTHTQTVKKTKPCLELDFSSIAKGHAVDQVARLLEERYHAQDFLVEIGGEVVAQGHSPRGGPWQVGIEMPNLAQTGSVIDVVSLGNEAIATSGSYRQWVMHEGKRRSHTIDPKTGTPKETDLVSVSVIASTCALADAWATALMAAGYKEARELAETQGLAAVFLVSDATTATRDMPPADSSAAQVRVETSRSYATRKRI